VKQRELLRTIARAAAARHITWSLVRHGANHDVYRLGSETIPIPRHAEIQELTANGILKECSTELGEGWWKE